MCPLSCSFYCSYREEIKWFDIIKDHSYLRSLNQISCYCKSFLHLDRCLGFELEVGIKTKTNRLKSSMIGNRCGSSQKNCWIGIYLVPDETVPISFVFILYTLQTYRLLVNLCMLPPKVKFWVLKTMPMLGSIEY